MMKKLSILFLLLHISIFASKAQNDTMYVYEGDQIIWKYAVSDIDSIVFYPNEDLPRGLPKITGFVNSTFVDENGNSFFPWGFNYTNPEIIGLIEDNWDSEATWDIMEEDFIEMSAYGANVVRIHLQYVKFMESANTPNADAFEKLDRLAQIADKNNLYLIVTGLGAYRLSDAQDWYDEMDDAQRWETQQLFWKTVAATLNDNSCVFAYDLINEPVVANGCHPDSISCSWYPPGGEFGGYQFVQNISIDPNNSYWQTIAEWSEEITTSIKEEDDQTMITVGLLPLGPIASLSQHFDIISTHVYPKSADLNSSVNYVISNQSDKPFLIEEFYNLSCSASELVEFLNLIEGKYHGLVGHYFGKTLEEYDENILVEAIHKQFLQFFIDNNPNE